MKTKNIPDSVYLESAASKYGYEIPVYDNGWGPLWIMRDSMGIVGIVRTREWHEAYEICEDEFLPAGDEDANAELARIEALPDGEEKNHEQACWDEAYGWRNNTRRMPDGSLSSIYAKDLNGERLDPLTPKLVRDLELRLKFKAH